MAGYDSHIRWIFTQNQFEDTPSRRHNIDANQELSLRKTGTKLIECIGHLLKLRQICLNTAFIYFHRFFMFRSFKQYDTNEIGICALFIASKYNEQPIPMEHVIRAYHSVINDTKKRLMRDNDDYKILCDKLIANENEMLLIFGFNLSVIHSHAIIVSAGHKLSLKEEITQNAFYIATELIKSSTLCLQYEPSMIACIAIYLSNKLSNNMTSNDVMEWCRQIDADIKPKTVKEIANKHESCLTTLNLDYIRKKQRKRTHSSGCNSSPESAYSSGSNNSPIYDQMNNNSLSPPLLHDNSTKDTNSITFSTGNKRFCSAKSISSVKQLTVNSTNQKLETKSSLSLNHNLSLSTDNMINLKCIKKENSSDCVAYSSVKPSSITPTLNSSDKSKIINLNSVKTEDCFAKLGSVKPQLNDPRMERKNIDCIQSETDSVTNHYGKTNNISTIPQNDLNNKNKELKIKELNRNVRKPIVYNVNTNDTNECNKSIATEAKSFNNTCVVNGLSDSAKSSTINGVKYSKKQFQIPKNFMITVQCNDSVNNKDLPSVRTVRECGAND